MRFALLITLAACGRVEGAAGDTASGEGTWFWGDLHAHSGWSYDGCELPDRDCASPDSGPASGFFAAAALAGLDFAALTDHAEADVYWPLGLGGEGLAVWEGQAATVAEADGVLGVLGFEWTGFRSAEVEGHPRGSHRTILLEGADACEGYRVPGRLFEDGVHARDRGTAVYEQLRRAEVTDAPADLWAALDAAEAACGTVRWVSFAHHSAYEIPEQTDWTFDENAPRRETVVEVFSEHGSSECADTDASGCDWQVNEESGYFPDGAVQTALARGYRLGFVGGTDSHDALPGSLADGPGPVAQWSDGDEPDRHFAAGGLTGAFVPGELTTASLFDAIEARRTVASSGPRPELWAYAEGADGLELPIGSEVPASSLPLEIRASVPVDEGARVVVELLAPEGGGVDVVASQEGGTFQATWDPEDGGFAYLRLRFLSEVGDEERIWVSPWFAEEADGCRCGSAEPTPGAGLLAFALGLGLRRRRALA